MTGKVFEYLASLRPILTICSPENDIISILDETGAGQLCCDKIAISNFLRQKISESRGLEWKFMTILQKIELILEIGIHKLLIL